MLEEIFKMQEELNNKTLAKNGHNLTINDISKDEKLMKEWGLQYARCLGQELSETIDCFPWKHWSKDKNIDHQNLKVEIVDMLHFWVSIAQVAGLSAKDCYELYLQKNKVNHNRQDSGTYSMETKTEADNEKISLSFS